MSEKVSDADLYLAPVADVKAGTRLICDDGFTCLDDDEIVTVATDERGDLYVPCRCGPNGETGAHYLDGQLVKSGTHYIGFRLALQGADHV